MPNFKKLKKGGIILVIAENHQQRIIHAISLSSSGLRHSNYHHGEIEPGWDNIEEIRDRFNEQHYQFNPNVGISPDAFAQRLLLVKNKLFGVFHYKQTG